MTERSTGQKPVPVPSEISAPFWAACREGRLTYLRCDTCRTIVFPPEGLCTGCRSTALRWEESTGTGSVYTYTVIRREPSAGFPIPSVMAIVDLDEGYSMFSNVVGCEPDSVEIDMPVEVTFESLDDEIALPVFRPRPC